MEKIAKFEKVSLEQFTDYMRHNHKLADVEIENLYNWIELPARATRGSAGYDFYMPYDLEISPGSSVVIPTGIRCKMAEGWVLQIFPRSSLGFKYRLQLDNTVGIIDSDYYNADNEGHIMVKLTNNGTEKISMQSGDRFVQGVFLPYGITVDDQVFELRKGGFGSTDRNQPVTIEKQCNPTTGYNWEVTVSDSEVVEVSQQYKPNSEDENLAGGGGITTFTFTGLKKGECEVKLTYKRNWQEIALIEQNYRVIVSDELNVTVL